MVSPCAASTAHCAGELAEELLESAGRDVA
jgi:hypothetical protein